MENIIKKGRKRDKKGKYVQTVKGGWKTKQPDYQKTYLSKNPWAKNWTYSKRRAQVKGWEHTLKVSDFKSLWIRDKAHLLKSPSIDRIDAKKGYIQGNCRFIERSLNISLGNKGIPKPKKKHGANN